MSISSPVTGALSTAPGSSSVNPRPTTSWPLWLVWTADFIPTALVYALLAAVFVVGGQTGWKLPKFSELLGSRETTTEDDWCGEHLVPESQCVECQTALQPHPPEFGWCKAHGVAECVLCHPELAQLAEPLRSAKFDTLPALALRPRAENNSRSTLHKKLVQFASIPAVNKAGIEVDVAAVQPMTETITANGEVTYDPTRVAHLSPRVPGTVWKVLKGIGDPVAAGEILALVDAAQVGQVKAQLLQGVVELQLRTKNAARLRAVGDAIPGKTTLEAETAQREAEIKVVSAQQALVNLGFPAPKNLLDRKADELSEELRFWGIPPQLLAAVAGKTQTANLIPVVAPAAGVVVECDVVSGEVVDIAKPLFVVADLQRMWLRLHVRQEDARFVRLGQSVSFQTDDGAAATSGQIDWIAPNIDTRTRTLQVRVNLDAADSRLRDQSYGTGRILLRQEPRAIVVPREAVQSAGDVSLIFVRDKNYFAEDAPKLFHVRQVRLGARDERFVELLAGVLPGEVVATNGSNVLLSQLLRSNLGAGCACHDH